MARTNPNIESYHIVLFDSNYHVICQRADGSVFHSRFPTISLARRQLVELVGNEKADDIVVKMLHGEKL